MGGGGGSTWGYRGRVKFGWGLGVRWVVYMGDMWGGGGVDVLVGGRLVCVCVCVCVCGGGYVCGEYLAVGTCGGFIGYIQRKFMKKIAVNFPNCQRELPLILPKFDKIHRQGCSFTKLGGSRDA